MAENLQIVLSASDQASPALKAVAGNAKAIGDAAKGASEVTGTAFGRMSGYVEQHRQTIQTVGLAMTAVGAITVAVAAKSIAAYNEQADAVARLDAAFRSSGQAIGSSGLQKLASDLQKVTPFADETTLAMMATLAAMGFAEDQIISLTPRVLNLSVAFGKDLTATAQALGRAILMESAGPLKRFGIIVDESALKTGNLSDVLVALDTNTKGMAESAGKAGSGPMKIFHNQLGEISESIGKALVPSLQIANKVLTPVVELITKVADTKAGQTLIAVATGAGIAVGGFGLLVTIAAPVVLGIRAIQAALIKVAETAAATAAIVSASAGEMAAATTAAGVAAGAGAAAGGIPSAIKGATAAAGAGILLRRGAGAVGRFAAGKTALGFAGPVGVGAAVALTGYELYAARKQAAAEQQITDIENAPYNAVQQATMGRWKAAREASGAGLQPADMGAALQPADLAALESDIWTEDEASALAAVTQQIGEDVGQQIVQGYTDAAPEIAQPIADNIASAITAEIAALAPADPVFEAAFKVALGQGLMRAGVGAALFSGGVTSEQATDVAEEQAPGSEMIWDEKNQRFRRVVRSAEASSVNRQLRAVAGMQELGPGAWQLGAEQQPGWLAYARGGVARPRQPKGDISFPSGRPARTTIKEDMIINEETLPDGTRKVHIIFTVPGVSPGILTDGVTDWMTDLQYADAGAVH